MDPLVSRYMKYKVGDEVLVKARIINGTRRYFGVEIEDNRFDVCEDDIVPVPKMTAEEAWEIAKRICTSDYDGCDNVFSRNDLNEIFGNPDYSKIMNSFTSQEAKAKIEAWESEKEIKVGDEVDICGDKGIVTSFGTDGDMIHVIYLDGIVNSYRKDKDIKKTGRHIDIAGMLKQIGGTDA